MSEQAEPESAGLPEPVTVVVRRAVRAGKETEYEAWLERLTSDVAGRLPGYLGAEFQKPPPGSNRYTSAFRFDSLANLERFEQSDLRLDYLAEVAPLVEEDAVWERFTGLEFWFEPPPGAVIPQPSRFRMALLLTSVVYLLVLGIGTAAAAVIGDAIPTPLRLLAVITVEVFLMTYLILPRLTRLLSRWIYPTSKTV